MSEFSLFFKEKKNEFFSFYKTFLLTDLQSPGYHRIINEGNGLRINESIGFRCSLETNPSTKSTSQQISQIEYLRKRLSHLQIKEIPNIDRNVPDSSSLDSFLMKHETKHIGVIRQNVNSEEFNNIVKTHDPHMTVVLTWKAIVSDNSSAQRITYGQHLVQLRNLYETYVKNTINTFFRLFSCISNKH